MEDRMNVQGTAGSAAASGVTLAELPPVARFSLRAGPDGRAAAAEILGLALPERIGERAVAGSRSGLCLGPDEWMLQADEAEREAIAGALADLAARTALSAVDISDRELALVLEGPAALDLLATGCPLDLARMPTGSGTRTLFDTVQVVLVREAEDRFRLEVWRSFAPHVRALLDTATRELAAGL
jgi:sarcosine oxidase, subunit gamma